MVQLFSRETCSEQGCRRKTDEACDWCAFVDNVGTPVCARHRFTRSPWGGEIHTLCREHLAHLHAARAAMLLDRATPPVWRWTKAHEYEPYLLDWRGKLNG